MQGFLNVDVIVGDVMLLLLTDDDDVIKQPKNYRTTAK